MNKVIPDPFWLMLAANAKTERVTVLGFSTKSETEALALAKQRAKSEDEVRVFGMHNDAIAIGTAIRTWLVSLGAPEDEANNVIQQLAEDMRKRLRR
jgi:hypothetical protein